MPNFRWYPHYSFPLRQHLVFKSFIGRLTSLLPIYTLTLATSCVALCSQPSSWQGAAYPFKYIDCFTTVLSTHFNKAAAFLPSILVRYQRMTTLPKPSVLMSLHWKRPLLHPTIRLSESHQTRDWTNCEVDVTRVNNYSFCLILGLFQHHYCERLLCCQTLRTKKQI